MLSFLPPPIFWGLFRKKFPVAQRRFGVLVDGKRLPARVGSANLRAGLTAELPQAL
jgi:hypothetical protein